MRPKATPPALAELLDEELRLKCGTAMQALRIKPGKLAQKLDCDARDLGRWLNLAQGDAPPEPKFELCSGACSMLARSRLRHPLRCLAGKLKPRVCMTDQPQDGSLVQRNVGATSQPCEFSCLGPRDPWRSSGGEETEDRAHDRSW